MPNNGTPRVHAWASVVGVLVVRISEVKKRGVLGVGLGLGLGLGLGFGLHTSVSLFSCWNDDIPAPRALFCSWMLFLAEY